MIFVDTGAWVALEDKKDTHHAVALQFKSELLATKNRLITTNFILDETYTLLLLDVGYGKTVNFKHALDELIHHNVVVVFHITPDIEIEAWEVFKRFNQDKNWSFTDCTSKVIMERLGIVEAFSFDHHFEQMGFNRRPFLSGTQ
ncbi:MAG: type II toxin-antitoxin system VapC family toxin [candidate division KSB1 bacterium]|nr:type II toxin-antitoxin system VapC family toxin [candidate division KSB1 bacterium]MDZ7367147.1 type II toxin-antitoxin system VapC family toxin [candidate division KSB1 bacterium]MDZ7405125.1 type II toxin-antitoxin system VapC family toxin [candidate division KSB1 bacterium]